MSWCPPSVWCVLDVCSWCPPSVWCRSLSPLCCLLGENLLVTQSRHLDSTSYQNFSLETLWQVFVCWVCLHYILAHANISVQFQYKVQCGTLRMGYMLHSATTFYSGPRSARIRPKSDSILKKIRPKIKLSLGLSQNGPIKWSVHW